MLFAIALLAQAFIPAECCRTHGCCFEIAATDLRDLGQDRYLIFATAEIFSAQRSPDGRWWRCACVFDATQKRYFADSTAKTRCLFTPHQGT